MPFRYVNRLVFPVGRVTPSGVNLLGTATLLPEPGTFATVGHVTTADDQNLVIVLKDYESINDYQDTADTQAKTIPAKIQAIDPITDLCVLTTDADAKSDIILGDVDAVSVGDTVHIFGYPHADHGRLVLTYQRAPLPQVAGGRSHWPPPLQLPKSSSSNSDLARLKNSRIRGSRKLALCHPSDRKSLKRIHPHR